LLACDHRKSSGVGTALIHADVNVISENESGTPYLAVVSWRFVS
jgi:hypothetical protein